MDHPVCRKIYNCRLKNDVRKKLLNDNNPKLNKITTNKSNGYEMKNHLRFICIINFNILQPFCFT